jgi:hypothetical protein
MSKALMHRCIDQPNLPCPGCEADCAEETEILAESSAGQDQEYPAKRCPTHGDFWRDDGSCPQCDQDKLEEIRSGNWFGITCAIMLFCLPAFGQAAYSGHGSYSGSAAFGSPIGAPLTYSARTDNCVTGAETGCIGGRTTGQAGSAMSFLYNPTDTVPFANLAPANTAATDPDFNTYMVLVTDTSAAAPPSVNFQVPTEVFNQDSTLLLANQSGGGTWLYQINPTLIHAKGCSPSTPCAVKSQIRDGATNSTHLVSGGSPLFSHIPGENNVLYERSANGTIVYKDTINTSGAPSGWTLTRAVWVDFTSDTPVPCSVLPASYSSGWSSLFTIGNDASFTYAMSGGQDWQSAWTPPVTETFIVPQTNNSGHKGFQATTVAGASGGTEPNWAVDCNTLGSTCTDGGITWTNVGGAWSQGPGFDVVSYQTGAGCSYINSRLGKIYRGTGNVQPAGYWTTDDDMVCARLGQTAPCSIGDTMTMHGATQIRDPAYARLDPTGAGAVSCLVPGTCSCADTSSVYQGAWSDATTYALHDLVFYSTVYYQSKTAHTGHANGYPDVNTTDWRVDDAYCYTYIWQRNSTTIRPCIMVGGGGGGPVNSCDGHEEVGYSYFYAGGKAYSHSYSKPTIGGHPNPGVQMLVAPLPADHHAGTANTGPGDLQPQLMAGTDVPTHTSGYTAAGYAEDIGVSTDGAQTMYRFLHNYNTGSSPQYTVQNALGTPSQDGTLAAIGSDMMGRRGSTSWIWIGTHAYALGDTIFPTAGNPSNVEFIVTVAGTSSGTEPTWSACTSTCTDSGGVTYTNTGKSCNNLRALSQPLASTAFATNDLVLPINNNVAQNIYQASPGGTTGGNIPNWNSLCPNYGDRCSDGATVSWLNEGPNTCRGDIVLFDLLSAHPLP